MQTNYKNLFSTESLDRLEEIYQATMGVMDDATLQAYCLTNKYNTNLCNDNFWLRRIKEHNLELLLPYRSLYPSLQSFYFNVRKDACYIVSRIGIDRMNNNIYAFNNIEEAKGCIDNLINQYYEFTYDYPDGLREPYYGDEEIQLNYQELTSDYEIYVLFNNIVVTIESLSYYSIFNLRPGSPNYINPNIMRFPLLSHEFNILCYTKLNIHNSLEIVMLPFESRYLRILPTNSNIYYILEGSTISYKKPDIWSKVDFGIMNNSILMEDDVLLLVDKLLVRDPKGIRLPQHVIDEDSHGFAKSKLSEHIPVVIDKNTYDTIIDISRSFEKYHGRLESLLPSLIEGLLSEKWIISFTTLDSIGDVL